MKLRHFPFISSLVILDPPWKINTNDYLDMGRKYKSTAGKHRKVSPVNRLGEREVTT